MPQSRVDAERVLQFQCTGCSKAGQWLELALVRGVALCPDTFFAILAGQLFMRSSQLHDRITACWPVAPCLEKSGSGPQRLLQMDFISEAFQAGFFLHTH